MSSATRFTDSLGNPLSLDDPASLRAINDFVEGFISCEARAVNVLAAADDPNPIVQAYSATLHLFAESRDAVANARPFIDRAQASSARATPREQRYIAAIAAWAQRQGYAGADGTSWELMRSGCEHFGLYAQELSLTEAAVFGALEAGQPIICSMRPGDFTTAGHFIVLTGTQDGLLCVVDPNSPARSASLWEYSRLEPQIKNLWAYTA